MVLWEGYPQERYVALGTYDGCDFFQIKRSIYRALDLSGQGTRK